MSLHWDLKEQFSIKLKVNVSILPPFGNLLKPFLLICEIYNYIEKFGGNSVNINEVPLGQNGIFPVNNLTY